jgi:protein-tyrosine phosphatase
MPSPFAQLSQFLSRLRHSPEPDRSDPPCYWEVDIHSHLVPGVDDGVLDPAQTLACLRQFVDWGIKRVVTTPHISQDRYRNSPDTLLAWKSELQQLIEYHHIPVKFEVAAEYMLDDLFLELLHKDELLSFGSERYVLFELGRASAPRFVDEIVFHLRVKGYQPVLAHPERYFYFHENPKPLAEFRRGGCLFQLNWGSFTGRYGRRVKTQAQQMLKSNWVDFVGSDIHHPNELPKMETFFSTPEYAQLKSQKLLNQSLNSSPAS